MPFGDSWDDCENVGRDKCVSKQRYSFGEEVAPAYGRCPGPCVQFFYATWLQ